MRVLGLDPSLRATGFGIIECEGNNWTVIEYGVIKPAPRMELYRTINAIRLQVEDLITTHHPDEIAIENAFYAHNVRTALILGQVRGAVLVAVASYECTLYEYSALEIKKAVTGYGQADKNQVSVMVKTLLNIDDDHMAFDASDALAAAICHANSRIFQQRLNETQKE